MQTKLGGLNLGEHVTKFLCATEQLARFNATHSGRALTHEDVTTTRVDKMVVVIQDESCKLWFVSSLCGPQLFQNVCNLDQLRNLFITNMIEDAPIVFEN